MIRSTSSIIELAAAFPRQEAGARQASGRPERGRKAARDCQRAEFTGVGPQLHGFTKPARGDEGFGLGAGNPRFRRGCRRSFRAQGGEFARRQSVDAESLYEPFAVAAGHRSGDRLAGPVAQGDRSDQREGWIPDQIRAPRQRERLGGGEAHARASKAARAQGDGDAVRTALARQGGDHRDELLGMAAAEDRELSGDHLAVIEQGDRTGLGRAIDRQGEHGVRRSG
jgi:hypothetical protein